MAAQRLKFIKLGLAAIIGAFTVAILALQLLANAKREPVQATVTAIRPADDAYHAMVWVTARTSTGAVNSRIVPLKDLQCRVGDAIDGELRGAALSLHERTCRRPS